MTKLAAELASIAPAVRPGDDTHRAARDAALIAVHAELCGAGEIFGTFDSLDARGTLSTTQHVLDAIGGRVMIFERDPSTTLAMWTAIDRKRARGTVLLVCEQLPNAYVLDHVQLACGGAARVGGFYFDFTQEYETLLGDQCRRRLFADNVRALALKWFAVTVCTRGESNDDIATRILRDMSVELAEYELKCAPIASCANKRIMTYVFARVGGNKNVGAAVGARVFHKTWAEFVVITRFDGRVYTVRAESKPGTWQALPEDIGR